MHNRPKIPKYAVLVPDLYFLLGENVYKIKQIHDHRKIIYNGGMEKLRCLVIDLEGTTREITQRLNEVISGIEQEGGIVKDVKVTHAREHGIDGFVVLYTITYKISREIPEE